MFHSICGYDKGDEVHYVISRNSLFRSGIHKRSSDGDDNVCNMDERLIYIRRQPAPCWQPSKTHHRTPYFSEPGTDAH